MSIKEGKTIAEYVIRKWLIEQNFAVEYFTLTMKGNVGILTDQQGDTLKLIYDPSTKSVHAEGENNND